MRPKIQVYLTEDELSEVKRAARRRRVTVSRYAKERLIPFDSDDLNSDLNFPNSERLIATARNALERGNRTVLEQLQMLIVMLDQFALASFRFAPEVSEVAPESTQAAAQLRHQTWQENVENMITRLRQDRETKTPASSLNGANP